VAGHILVDANSLGHAMHSAAKLTVGKFQTQAIFGSVKAIRELYAAYPDRELLVLWDGKAKHRFELLPEYKGNRKPKTPKEAAIKEAYKAQVPLLQKLLASLGVKQLLDYEMEADDLAGYLSQRLATPTLLYTGDRDWQQLVRDGVSWLDHRDGASRVTPENFFETTGYKTPRQFLEGKALMGDGSDNIKGVGRIGEKGAPELIAAYGSVDGLRKYCATVGTAGMSTAWAKLTTDETYAIFLRNLKLMNLLSVPAPDLGRMHDFKRGYSEPAVRAIFERLAFVSILKDFDNFLRVFRERHAQPERKAA
jgi:5'-3' exonuclease